MNCQNFLLNSPAALSKNQNLPASPPLLQMFSSLLKTISIHVSSAESVKLITPPSSSFFFSLISETPHSSQLKLQPQSHPPLPVISPVTSPYTTTFLFSPTPTAHLLFSVTPSTSHHHPIPHTFK